MLRLLAFDCRKDPHNGKYRRPIPMRHATSADPVTRPMSTAPVPLHLRALRGGKRSLSRGNVLDGFLDRLGRRADNPPIAASALFETLPSLPTTLMGDTGNMAVGGRGGVRQPGPTRSAGAPDEQSEQAAWQNGVRDRLANPSNPLSAWTHARDSWFTQATPKGVIHCPHAIGVVCPSMTSVSVGLAFGRSRSVRTPPGAKRNGIRKALRHVEETHLDGVDCLLLAYLPEIPVYTFDHT